MRVMAFDFGMKYIGVALGNTDYSTTQTLGSIKAKDGIPIQQDLCKMIADWQPELLLVGLPEPINPSTTHIHHAAKKFGYRMKVNFKINLEFIDEAMSTQEAKSMINSGKKDFHELNSIAALVLLKRYMHI